MSIVTFHSKSRALTSVRVRSELIRRRTRPAAWLLFLLFEKSIKKRAFRFSDSTRDTVRYLYVRARMRCTRHSTHTLAEFIATRFIGDNGAKPAWACRGSCEISRTLSTDLLRTRGRSAIAPDDLARLGTFSAPSRLIYRTDWPNY